MFAVERIPIERNSATRHARGDAAVVALAVVALLWIGALLGVSFLATPVKFLAPSLSMPVALDVGRQTFRWFGRVETFLAFAAFAGAVAVEMRDVRGFVRAGKAGALPRTLLPGGPPLATLLTVLLLAAVAVQGLWLLPLLDARVEIILQGGTPPPSSLHDLYVVIEAMKLGALVGVAWIALDMLLRRPAEAC